MRFSMTRLCGGEALMLIPRDEGLSFDLEMLDRRLSEEGYNTHLDGLMLIMNWRNMEVTVYEQGKIMFHPLKDRSTAVRYANELLQTFKDLSS